MLANKEQLEAISSVDGAFRLIAGAGSGKTYTLTKRVEHICKNKNIEPNRVLCLTFTNKATNEMVERLSKLMGLSEDNFYISTYHHFAYDVVKRDCEVVFGWEDVSVCQMSVPLLVSEWVKQHEDLFKDLDEGTKEGLISYLMSKVNIALSKGDYVAWMDISNEEEPLATTQDILSYSEKDTISRKAFESYKRVVQKYDETEKIKASALKMEEVKIPYEERQNSPVNSWVKSIIRSKNGYITFDDIINMAVYMLENYDDIRDYWQNQFDYVQCDEFQDTDMMQLRLVKAVYEKHGNLFVVGDPDQSIYLFRGAEPSVLTNLGEYIPDLHTIYMVNNYRSTEEIVSVSDKVIELNKNRIQKHCVSMCGSGKDSVKVICEKDAYEVAKKECEEIKNLLNQGVEPSEIAVLYSNKSDMVTNELQKLLNFEGIIFNTTLKQDTTYQDFTLNLCKYKHSGKKNFLYDAVSILNTADRYVDVTSIQDIEYSVDSFYTIADFVLKSFKKTNGKPTAAYQRFLDQLDSVEASIQETLSYWQGLDSARKNFLCEVSIDSVLNEVEPEDGEGVSILTIHRSKGLEWEYVFVNGLENSTFLSSRDSGDVRIEKARLAYVAYSRAKKVLHIGSSSEEEGLSSFISQIIEEPYISIQDNSSVLGNIKDLAEHSISEYLKGIDNKKKIEYNPLFLDNDLVGYRCSYYLNGELVCYQATIEDLDRLGCIPKERVLLVKIGKLIKVIRKEDNNVFYTNDYQDGIVRLVSLSEDADVLTVFEKSNKPYTKDIKDVDAMSSLVEKYNSRFVRDLTK